MFCTLPRVLVYARSDAAWLTGRAAAGALQPHGPGPPPGERAFRRRRRRGGADRRGERGPRPGSVARARAQGARAPSQRALARRWRTQVAVRGALAHTGAEAVRAGRTLGHVSRGAAGGGWLTAAAGAAPEGHETAPVTGGHETASFHLSPGTGAPRPPTASHGRPAAAKSHGVGPGAGRRGEALPLMPGDASGMGAVVMGAAASGARRARRHGGGLRRRPPVHLRVSHASARPQRGEAGAGPSGVRRV
jgi:hypothetical protein